MGSAFDSASEAVVEFAELNDEQLAAAAAREGSDGPAFVALVTRFQDRVWRVCHRLMGNEEDAADATQEVFVRLFFNRKQFRGDSKYSTWVHGVALRTCLTLRRGRARRWRRETAAGEERGRETDDGTITESPERSIDLMRMLDILDEEDRAMLLMKYAEGHSYDDLAQMFDLSKSACKMRVSRARTKLQERFPDYAFDDPNS